MPHCIALLLSAHITFITMNINLKCCYDRRSSATLLLYDTTCKLQLTTARSQQRKCASLKSASSCHYRACTKTVPLRKLSHSFILPPACYQQAFQKLWVKIDIIQFQETYCLNKWCIVFKKLVIQHKLIGLRMHHVAETTGY